jgi:hypothetical protein
MQGRAFSRHPSESWKSFSTAEWLVIHFDLSFQEQSTMDPSFRWDDDQEQVAFGL